jgi:hypothetical protein
MRKPAWTIALTLLVAMNAGAFPPTAHIGTKLITTGDTRQKVEDAGAPDRVEEVNNAFGVKVAEDWIYESSNHTITVRIDNSGFVVFVRDDMAGR